MNIILRLAKHFQSIKIFLRNFHLNTGLTKWLEISISWNAKFLKGFSHLILSLSLSLSAAFQNLCSRVLSKYLCSPFCILLLLTSFVCIILSRMSFGAPEAYYEHSDLSTLMVLCCQRSNIPCFIALLNIIIIIIFSVVVFWLTTFLSRSYCRNLVLQRSAHDEEFPIPNCQLLVLRYHAYLHICFPGQAISMPTSRRYVI